MPDIHASNEAVATQEPSVAVSDAELERLLNEATSLSQEIAEEAGEISKEASTEEGGDQTAPATTPVDVTEPEAPDTAAPPAAEQAKPLPNLLQDPDATTASAPAEAEPEPTANQDTAPAAAPRPSVKIETRDEEIAANAASPDAVGDESGESTDGQEGEDPHHGPSIKERLVGACRLAASLGRTVPISLANGFLSIFILLDRPFRDVSPERKQVLGLVALATLMAGVAAWILPDMMNGNPFSEMELRTKRG